MDVFYDKNKISIIGEKIARFSKRAAQFEEHNDLYSTMGEFGKSLKIFNTTFKSIISEISKNGKVEESNFKGFNLFAGENYKAAGGFEHSGLFALVDKEGKIRCRKDAQGNPILYYDGLEADGVQAIKEDIKKLLEE
jgi:hypothetical protein